MPPIETLALRAGAIVAGLALWFFTQRLIGARTLGDTQHSDHLHVLTGGWNRWLHARPRAANAVLVASSLGVDIVTLFVLARAVFGPTFSPFWGLLILFLMRQVSQALVALPPPPGIIWRDPGFPSLFVTYGVGNDFFFSGHTALAVYGAMQLAALGIPAITVAGIVVAVLQVVAVIALRAHWTVDVVAGLAAAIAVGLMF
ncbi:MAG: phosphatase PAP2-related protein [Burkholderiales bacterium]